MKSKSSLQKSSISLWWTYKFEFATVNLGLELLGLSLIMDLDLELNKKGSQKLHAYRFGRKKYPLLKKYTGQNKQYLKK